jgi:Family of unknown function (DUF6130)
MTMIAPTKILAALVITTILASPAGAQSAKQEPVAVPFVFPVENEPAPKLIVEPPLPEVLARGAVLIPYRVENLRILPVLGMDAANISPRIGHLHITVDDLPWHWGDFSGANTIVVVGLPPGPHKVVIELARADHHVFTAQTVNFTIPDPKK